VRHQIFQHFIDGVGIEQALIDRAWVKIGIGKFAFLFQLVPFFFVFI